jgi:maltose O-acetyltransferase
MYRRMGVEIGDNCNFQFDVIIDYSHYWLISIGNNVTLAPRVHILAHDASTKLHLGYTKIAMVRIEDNVFIGAGTIVLPGVKIGKNAIIGAGSIVTKDIPENVVAAGNPARIIYSLEEYVSTERARMIKSPKFDFSYTVSKNVNVYKRKEMKKQLSEIKVGFLE